MVGNTSLGLEGSGEKGWFLNALHVVITVASLTVTLRMDMG